MPLDAVMGFVVPVAPWDLLMGSEGCLEASQASPSSVLNLHLIPEARGFGLPLQALPGC